MTPREELQALAVVDDGLDSLLVPDPEVGLPATADRAALTVDWIGFRDLCTQSPGILDGLPKPKEHELAHVYIKRIWPLLEADERGTALEMGLQKMVTMGRISEVGVQLRIWRAYVSGDWQGSPECCDTFREWVHHVLTDTLEASTTEATHLANVVEAVAWLAKNDYSWLPKDDEDNPALEQCFTRPLYRRYRAVAAKILDRAKILGEVEARLIEKQREKQEVEVKDLQAAVNDIEQEITELVEHASDIEGYNTTDLDREGRTRPLRLPPIEARKDKRDPITGRTTITMEVSLAQEIVLQQKGRGWLDLLLEGEQYDRAKWDYVEYRKIGTDGWERRILPEDKIWCDDDWEPWAGSPVGALDTLAYITKEMTVLHYYVQKEDKDAGQVE